MRVIVVGGGVMGLACAYRLARGGAEVTLFERRACGAGATLASLGALWPAPPSARGPLQQLHRQSLWMFGAFVREIAATGGVPIAYRRGGHVEVLTSVKAANRAREEAVIACAEWTDAGIIGEPVMQVCERWPGVAVVEDAANGGCEVLRCAATGQVKVAQLVAGLKAACLTLGVSVNEGINVAKLRRDGERVTGVRIAEIEVAADAVLLAAGAWSAELSPDAEVHPVKGQGIALRPPEGAEAWSGGIVKRGGKESVYVVPWKDEVLVGSTTEPAADFDEHPTAEARTFLARRAGEIIPALRGAQILRHWAGLRPDGPGHQPIMGRAEPGLYLCTGHYKIGIGMSPACSKIIADAIFSSHTSHSMT